MSATNVDQVLRYKGFNVEIRGVDGAPTQVDSTWVTVGTGESKVECAGGIERVEAITLRGPLSATRSAMTEWLNDTITGGNPFRTVTITLIPFEKNGEKTLEEILEYYDACITRYVFPSVELAEPSPHPPIEEVRFTFSRSVKLL